MTLPQYHLNHILWKHTQMALFVPFQSNQEQSKCFIIVTISIAKIFKFLKLVNPIGVPTMLK